MFKRYESKKGLTNLYGSKDLFITENGEVKNINGIGIPVFMDKNGFNCVFCKLWDGEREYRLIDLLAITKGKRVL